MFFLNPTMDPPIKGTTWGDTNRSLGEGLAAAAVTVLIGTNHFHVDMTQPAKSGSAILGCMGTLPHFGLSLWPRNRRMKSREALNCFGYFQVVPLLFTTFSKGSGKPSHQLTKSLLTDPRWAWHWHLNPPLQPQVGPTIHPTDSSVRYPHPLVALVGTDIPKCKLHVPSFSGVKNALEKCNFACLMLQIHW